LGFNEIDIYFFSTFTNIIMLNKTQIIQEAKQSIQIQAHAIGALGGSISNHFVEAVEHIHAANARVIVSGIGKSGIIAQKIVATFNSTGTPSIYMHAADAIHGDLGMVQQNDTIIIISKSGESEEIKVLTRLVNKLNNCVIAICGNAQSFLANECQFFLDSTVSKEACPNNLAPTTSTTAQLVIGDALAICLLQMKGFSAQDFAKFHPGGALGKQLYLHVHDVSKHNAKPFVDLHASIQEIIITISANRLGATAVLENQNLVGIITDGDLRRMLEKGLDIHQIKARDIMSTSPKCIDQNELAVVALEKMRNNNIAQLVVLDTNVYNGFIHLHDLLKEGLA
jgi:arabinose-5-phosphate isomerase